MRFAIVSCTTSTEETFKNTSLGKSLSRLEKILDFSTKIFYENKEGLSTCYNKAIEVFLKRRQDELVNYKDSIDALVFVHDDVSLTDIFLDEKLETGFKTYGILGVAGSSKFSLNEPVVWHNSPKECWSGAVEHPMVNKDVAPGSFYYTLFGATPKTCAVIDGVFIAIDLTKIGKLRFQEEFMFHFYDLAFCMEAYFEKIKIGTTNVHLTHMSHGDYRNSGWTEMQDKFVKKYRK